MKRVLFLILTLLLLSTACRANLESLPTDGLTGAMSANETSSPNDESCTGAQCWVFASVTACEGTFDPSMNVMRTSFELGADETAFKGSDEELALFSFGNPLLKGSPEQNVRYRCVGDAELTAVPLMVDGQIVGYMAALQLPKLQLESAVDGIDVYENIAIRGVVANNVQAVNRLIGAVNGMPNYDGYLPYLQGQKNLFTHYPDSAFLQERALSQGVSAQNAALIGQLYVEHDEAKQLVMMLDIVISEGDELVESVVMATVDTMRAAGADEAAISTLFAEETNGRITVQFVDNDNVSGAQVTHRDDAGNVEVSVASQESEGEGESPSGDSGGTDPNDGEDPGGGTDPNGGDGGTDPNSGSGGNGGNGGDGGDKRTPWEVLKDLFTDVLIGALEGAITGILAGGLPGAIAGAGAGAVVGGLKFALGELDGDGVWINPGAGEGHPCLNPFLNC